MPRFKKLKFLWQLNFIHFPINIVRTNFCKIDQNSWSFLNLIATEIECMCINHGYLISKEKYLQFIYTSIYFITVSLYYWKKMTGLSLVEFVRLIHFASNNVTDSNADVDISHFNIFKFGFWNWWKWGDSRCNKSIWSYTITSWKWKFGSKTGRFGKILWYKGHRDLKYKENIRNKVKYFPPKYYLIRKVTKIDHRLQMQAKSNLLMMVRLFISNRCNIQILRARSFLINLTISLINFSWVKSSYSLLHNEIYFRSNQGTWKFLRNYLSTKGSISITKYLPVYLPISINNYKLIKNEVIKNTDKYNCRYLELLEDDNKYKCGVSGEVVWADDFVLYLH